mmetsp:Transcript_10014/g.29589  ORF Transcript_10014/g.29589 Transcript_10014/m.29589 type:complete len:239 (-) Transcript_10014:33-749(-)
MVGHLTQLLVVPAKLFACRRRVLLQLGELLGRDRAGLLDDVARQGLVVHRLQSIGHLLGGLRHHSPRDLLLEEGVRILGLVLHEALHEELHELHQAMILQVLSRHRLPLLVEGLLVHGLRRRCRGVADLPALAKSSDGERNLHRLGGLGALRSGIDRHVVHGRRLGVREAPAPDVVEQIHLEGRAILGDDGELEGPVQVLELNLPPMSSGANGEDAGLREPGVLQDLELHRAWGSEHT